MFSLYSLFDKVNFDIRDTIKLFDSMVNPILSYGSEVYGFHKSPDVEKVHLKFINNIMGLNRNVTNACIYGELGRFPLFVTRKNRIIKYWYKLRIP